MDAALGTDPLASRRGWGCLGSFCGDVVGGCGVICHCSPSKAKPAAENPAVALSINTDKGLRHRANNINPITDQA